MDLESIKKLAVDLVSNPNDTEKLVQGLDDIIKFTEHTVNDSYKLSNELEKTTQQLQKARETNIELFEQVTIDKSVNDDEVEYDDEEKPPSDKDIIETYGGNI